MESHDLNRARYERDQLCQECDEVVISLVNRTDLPDLSSFRSRIPLSHFRARPLCPLCRLVYSLAYYEIWDEEAPKDDPSKN